jgi:Zn-dependent protease with chaperone function
MLSEPNTLTQQPPDRENLFNEAITAALMRLPTELEDWVINKVTFLHPEQAELAHAIHGEQLTPYEGVIVLFDDLIEQTIEVQEFLILHEIAHIKLRHPQKPTQQQENEADQEANNWLNTTNKTLKTKK